MVIKQMTTFIAMVLCYQSIQQIGYCILLDNHVIIFYTFLLDYTFYIGQVTEDESLFTYPSGQTLANFSDPNHIPQFLDEIDNTTREKAKTVCGTNIQCIFDFVQTGNEELAKSTQEIEEQNEKNEQISSEFNFL